MHDERSSDASGLSEADDAAIVLGILTEAYPGLVAIDELVREVAGSAINHTQARVTVEDGVAELLSSGLAHRIEQFVFASRAAMRADALAR